MYRSAIFAFLAGGLVGSLALAQAPAPPAAPPAGSTGLCRDGTYWTGATKRGACHGHKGIQEWYASADGSGASASASGAPSQAPAASGSQPAPASAPAQASTPAPAASNAAPAKPATAAPRATPAPGGGPGLVWVNTSSKVYHCPSDRWYGKTKNGEYLSEADAIAQGDHADHGKACPK